MMGWAIWPRLLSPIIVSWAICWRANCLWAFTKQSPSQNSMGSPTASRKVPIWATHLRSSKTSGSTPAGRAIRRVLKAGMQLSRTFRPSAGGGASRAPGRIRVRRRFLRPAPGGLPSGAPPALLRTFGGLCSGGWPFGYSRRTNWGAVVRLAGDPRSARARLAHHTSPRSPKDFQSRKLALSERISPSEARRYRESKGWAFGHPRRSNSGTVIRLAGDPALRSGSRLAHHTSTPRPQELTTVRGLHRATSPCRA